MFCAEKEHFNYLRNIQLANITVKKHEKISNTLNEASHFGKLARLLYKIHIDPENDLQSELAPDQYYEQQKNRWETSWAGDDFNPIWKSSQIPPVLQRAIAEGWFPNSAAVLDIGCGDGEISRSLAEQNFEVLGIDYSASAVKRARETNENSSLKLSFSTADVTRLPPPQKLFDALIDIGCFHVIPKVFANKYKESIYSWSKPGARFLLQCNTEIGPHHNKPTEEERRNWWIAYILKTFEDAFHIEKIDKTNFYFSTERETNIPIPAIAAWMIRR